MFWNTGDLHFYLQSETITSKNHHGSHVLPFDFLHLHGIIKLSYSFSSLLKNITENVVKNFNCFSKTLISSCTEYREL